MVARANNAGLTHSLGDPIIPALVAAAGLHALLLGAVGFSFQWPAPDQATIAITVALTPAQSAPKEATHIASEHQLGDEAPDTSQTQLQLQTSLTLSRELDTGEGEPSPDASPADRLERQMQDLEDALSSVSDRSASSNPRLGAVAARKALDAEYLARWRSRVEQVGNALYRGEPPAGDGDVRLLVVVHADGTLERIRILRSSGNPALDRAAQDTVVLAAPFPRFSKELAERTPRLEIVRTWQFRSQPLSSP